MHQQRTAVLGREVARRGILPFPEPVVISWCATLVVALAALFVVGSSWQVLLFDLLVILSVLAVTLEIDHRESYGSRKAKEIRNKARRKRGEHIFVNPTDSRFGDPDSDPGWDKPVPLYRAEPVDLTGTGLDDMFIVEHRTPGDNDYYSVMIAMQGLAEGLRGDPEWAVTSSAFGRTLASFAKRSSFVRGIEILHRSVPEDLIPHESWVAEQIQALGPAAEQVLPAIASYGQLIDRIRPYSEGHRAYVVLILPKSGDLLSEGARVARRKDAPLIGGIAQVIRDETMRAVAALERAKMGRVEVYGEQRACAVIRSCLDPTFPLESHKGVRWENCWPSYVGGEDTVEVAGNWHTRVGTIPARSIEPVELGPLWLAPLLTGVAPDPGDDEIPAAPTIRTVMVRMDFVEASKAREAAKVDATQDRAKQIDEERKGKTTDGTSEVMASASARRREDLKPGTGHHGVIYSMALSVTGRDEDDALRACMRVEQAADECGISEIEWQNQRHDVAMFLTLPLGRGLAATKHTRAKSTRLL
ncbi:hypothetical protein ACFTWF_22640 [Rhodococcus sp. NPDC056960]|uniref:hypothetical protein n=1 Tax=Rhodococcus sp. NPDC056960 TaxID=3345982 RepID=UPI00363113FE